MMNVSPFKFLDSYTKEDRDIFFGREQEVEEIYTKIFQSKILLVYGASGTGKSSLISCGLGNKFEDTDWLPVNIRRGVNINESMKQQLEKAMLTPLSAKEFGITKILKSIYLDHFKPIYLVFDQFEELFIFGDKDEWTEFIETVRQVLDSELQVRFVFIIRGEYLEYLTEFEQTLPEIFSNRIRIEKMTRANAVNCIIGPCKSSGIEVQEHFPENLLTKLSPNKTEIELTYLQVFLDRIYKKANDHANEQITFSNQLLDELGNVGDVLSQFLDEQIELIPDSDKALALLKAFVSTDATKKQITARNAAEFVKSIGQDFGEKQADQIIQQLVNRRILKDKDEAGRYELRHDSIAAKIFEKITTYERDLIEVNQFITYAFSEHEKRAFLLNASDLAYIAPYESKLNLTGKIREFIDKSKSAVKKSKRNRKRIMITVTVISILLAISLLAVVYAFVQTKAAQVAQRDALTQKELAEQSKTSAEQQKTVAEQQKTLAVQERTQAEQQKQEADRQTKIAQEQSAIALIQRQEAEKQRLLANQLQLKAQSGEQSALDEKAKADAARLEAERFAELADKNSKEALKAKEEATRFRMLAIAQAMGAKAVQLQDKDQKMLVAQQAYLFNQQYGGYAYQADIYSGLYSAHKAMNGDQFNSAPVHKGSVKGLVAIAPNTFLSVGNDGKIFKVSPSTDPIAITLMDKHSYVFQSMALSQDKKMLAIGSEEGVLLLYEIARMRKIREVQAHQSSLWAMDFDEAGNLFTAGSGQTLVRWASESFQPTEVAKLGSLINSISYSPVRKSIAVGLASGDVILFSNSAEGVKSIGKVPTMKSVTAVKFNRAGSVLAVGMENGSILLWDLAGSELSQSLNGHQARVSDLQFDNTDKFLVSSSYDGSSMIWNMANINSRQIVLSDHGGWVLQSTFNTDGKYLVTGDAIGTIRTFFLDMNSYSSGLCTTVNRNLTRKEWDNFVGPDIQYTKTCPDK